MPAKITTYNHDSPPVTVYQRTSTAAARRSRQNRLDSQTANKRRELDLKEREIAVRESELVARRDSASGVPALSALATADALASVLAMLLNAALNPGAADALCVRAGEAWLRANGKWGIDSGAGAGENASLRIMLESLPNPNKINDPQATSLNEDLTNITEEPCK